MKRLLTLLFSLTVLASFAQYPVMTATVSGYVTEQGSNLAVEGHMVKISMYSYDSTGVFTTSEVYTNANGYYTFTGTISGTNGNLFAETLGCYDYVLYSEIFEITFNGNNVFTANFEVCDDTIACHADFYNYQLEGLTYGFMDNSWSTSEHTTSWSFGDGTYSYEQNPTKTYANPGQYEVTLSIGTPDSTCFDVTSQTIIVGEAEYCKAFFTYWNNPSMENTISFADSSMGSPTNWFWEFGDGATSTDQFPIHTYEQEGFYFVCLTITDDSTNCYSNYCTTVMVGNSDCMSQFTYSPAVDSLNTFATQFYDLSYGAPTQWSWSFGDGTSSSEQNPIHVYAEAGVYLVCLTISGAECESTWCMEVFVDQVYPMCYNYFTYSNAGTSVMFEGYCTSNLPTTYFWDFGDGTSMEGNPVTHTYPAPGIYYVTLETWDNTGCRAYSSQEIVVGDTILYNQVYGQVFEDNFPLTSGFVMIFSVEDGNNYYPYFDMAMVDANGVYSFPMVPQGNYNLLAVPTDGGQYLPTYFESTLFWQEAQTVVAGQVINPLNINLQSAQGNATMGTGVIAGHINQSAVRDGFVGQVIMYLTDSEHNILKFTRVSEAGDFSFNNLANGNYYLKAELAGVYSEYIPVTLSSNQTEVTVQMTFTGNSILGKEEGISSTADVSVYPNPATDATRIVFKQVETGTVKISMLDIAGRTISTMVVNGQAGTSKADLDLTKYQTGIYMLRLQFKDGSEITRKLIIE